MSTPKTGLCKLGAARKFAARPGLWIGAIGKVARSGGFAGRTLVTAAVASAVDVSGCCVVASGDANDGVGSGETNGVAVGLTAAVGAGRCCCEKPKPNMSSGIVSKPNAIGKPQLRDGDVWGGGTGLRVKNCPSPGTGFVIIEVTPDWKVGGTEPVVYFERLTLASVMGRSGV
jgi:hypothetical protein